MREKPVRRRFKAEYKAHILREADQCTQQAAEKMLKALLAALGVDYPKTHNLRVVIEFQPRQCWS